MVMEKDEKEMKKKNTQNVDVKRDEKEEALGKCSILSCRNDRTLSRGGLGSFCLKHTNNASVHFQILITRNTQILHWYIINSCINIKHTNTLQIIEHAKTYAL